MQKLFAVLVIALILGVSVFLMAQTHVFAALDVANTWTGLQTFGAGKIAFNAADIPSPSIPTAGTSLTMLAPVGYGYCTGTCTVSIPMPPVSTVNGVVVPNQFCILNDNNVATAITLSALGSGGMYENSARTAYGTAGTGTLVLAAALKNKVCISGRDATHYSILSADGGAITVN